MAETKNASSKLPAGAAGTDEDEFYDSASDSFPKAEHLAPSVPPKFGPGRLVAIWPTGHGTRKNERGETYPFVTTVTLTLDDGPDGDLTGPGWSEDAVELIPPGVVRLDDFQHSTSGLVARLQRRLVGRNADGVPLKFRPMIGRMNTQASKANKNVPAYSISAVTDADKVTIRQHGDRIRAINTELEDAATTGSADPDTAAFSE
jgi:hypothetical protein